MVCSYFILDLQQIEAEFADQLNEIVTPIDVDRLRYYLGISKFDQFKSKELVKGFTEGFDIGYRGPKNRQDSVENIPFTIGSESEMWEKLMKEVKLKRYAGPFEKCPYKYFIQSPIGLVPKAGNQTRLIFHLSYNFGEETDQKSVNFHTPDDLCTVKYRDLDHAVRTCLELDRKAGRSQRHEELTAEDDADIPDLLSFESEHERLVTEHISSKIYLAKSDLKSAFRILPILPSQRCFLVMKARNPESKKFAFFVDKCLPFGASVSCAKFTLFSESLRHIVEFVTGRYHTVTNYLDDFLFIAHGQLECDNMVRAFLNMCQDIGCPVALEKTEWSATLMVFLGILIDGENRLLLIPDEKRIKALNMIKWAISKKKVTIKFIQRLTGTLNFLHKAIVPGRTFTREMYAKLKTTDKSGLPLKHYHHVNLGQSFVNDCQVWEQFLLNADAKCLCRPFVDFNR